MSETTKMRFRLELLNLEPEPVVVVDAPNRATGKLWARRYFEVAYRHQIKSRRTFFYRVTYDGVYHGPG